MTRADIPQSLTDVAPAWLSAALRADTATAVQWILVSSANWIATFEAENPRDAQTIQSHWRRLTAAVAATQNWK